MNGPGRGNGGRGKYEVSAIHAELLQSIQKLCLDERGAQPLRVWIDKVKIIFKSK